MGNPVRIPIQHWNAFQDVMNAGLHQNSYAQMVITCLRDSNLRQLGEWISDCMPPAVWAQGLERGFAPDSNDNADADADDNRTQMQPQNPDKNGV